MNNKTKENFKLNSMKRWVKANKYKSILIFPGNNYNNSSITNISLNRC